METFIFKGKGVHYWRAQTQHVRNFSELVRWFEREQGLSRARAIRAARNVAPERYNQHMAALHPNAQAMAMR